MDNQTVLQKVPFFADVLGADDLATLANGSSHIEYDRGSTLVREGDRGGSLYVIASGAVAVEVHDGGEQRTVTTLHEGEIVGEMSLLTGAPRSATVVAQRPTAVVEVPKAALEPILARSPELADRFAEMVDRRKAELQSLHGPLNWLRPSTQAHNLAALIRRHFGHA